MQFVYLSFCIVFFLYFNNFSLVTSERIYDFIGLTNTDFTVCKLFNTAFCDIALNSPLRLFIVICVLLTTFADVKKRQSFLGSSLHVLRHRLRFPVGKLKNTHIIVIVKIDQREKKRKFLQFLKKIVGENCDLCFAQPIKRRFG